MDGWTDSLKTPCISLAVCSLAWWSLAVWPGRAWQSAVWPGGAWQWRPGGSMKKQSTTTYLHTMLIC